MKNNPLRGIRDYGQSIWMDFIRRKMILSGELKQLIDEDGIRGVTSNPAIFGKVIDGSNDYDDAVSGLALQGRSAEEIYESLTVKDVQMTADLFRPLYDASNGQHGFVSLEVNPHLARDAEGTLGQARRLWQALARPNVMIKVPGTREGLSCIRQLISEGINVNVTLLFGLPRYREVAEAFIQGLEARAENAQAIDRVASVASFFLSRIDVQIDDLLKKRMEAQTTRQNDIDKVFGQVAIASARCAYQIYREMFEGERFGRLIEKGARPQRVLWASTSTKEAEFSDIKYVEALIGPDTINTLPRETLDAYRDHGRPARRLDLDLENARKVLEDLTKLDINIDQVTRDLEEQGIEKFNKPYDNSLKTLEKARKAALAARIDAQIIAVDEDTEQRINRELALWQKVNANQRLWNKDTGLWAVDPEQEETINRGLGWLDVISAVQDSVEDLTAFRSELLADGFRYVLHMGMGGSSLAPMVFQRSFAVARDGLTLFVLDSTDPATLYDYEQRLPLSQTLFIVASKSGTTAESLAFADYYYSLLKEKLGDSAGAHFAAITDRGTPLAELARERNFRRTFLNFEDIGGRYSALSYFGIVPAALMGLDVSEILTRAQRMLRACAADSPVQKSPGMVLGAALGELARQGRDKITFFVPPAMETLGMWLEQLLAESTGKQGTGLLPVTGEPIAPPSFYGNDRVFVHISLDSEPDDRLARSVAALREAGQPVIAIKMKDRLDVAQEFFRWEIATAAAGAVLGINPFDQPNVQESKDNTNRLLAVVQENGRLPEDKPLLADGGFQLYLPSGMVEPTLPRALAHFFEQVRPGDYIALLAYLTETAAVDTLLGRLRLRLQQQFKTATTLGYGPRYLHSTGQYHKGGPGNGLFVQLTCDDTRDLEVPGRPYTFGAFRQAQARGDLEALVAHERRVLRLHLGADPVQGLGQLRLVLENALSDLNEGR